MSDALPNSPGTIEHVVFDLGGVLLTWNPDDILSGLFPDPAVRAGVKQAVFLHRDWHELDRGTFTEEEATRRFIERTGRPAGEIEALMVQTMEYLRPMPESMAILERLTDAGLGLYCLSNMRARSLAYIRSRFDFLQKFRGMVASCEIGMLKPERAIYDHLTTRFGLAPSATVFIDDHLPNVEGAREAGLQAILFRNAADCRRRLSELAPLTGL